MPRKFLVVADDSSEFRAALHYAARRARSTGGRVALLKVLQPSTNDYFAGVREEIEAELRRDGEAMLNRLGAEAEERSGAKPEFLIEVGDTREALRRVVVADPDIKILVLAAVTLTAAGVLWIDRLAQGRRARGRPATEGQVRR